MTVHVVSAGDTLFSVASRYGVSEELLAAWNALTPPYALVVGQALLILTPNTVYTVRAGDTVYSVAQRFGVTARELFADNPQLSGGIRPLYEGQTLVLSYADEQSYTLKSNAYAYPFIGDEVLYGTLPYLTFLAPFTYGFTPEGTLIPLEDERLRTAARSYGTAPLMHLSTLTENGSFSSALASAVLNDRSASQALIENVLQNIRNKDYYGLDIDFEFIGGEDADAYADFVRRARERLNSEGFPVIVALAPKTSRDQAGQLYMGHDYAKLGAAANEVFLMTYEWGYTYGPPMAVAPLGSVRRVLDFAVSEIPAEKIYMGLPNYGYDWTLPYKSGETRARLIGNEEAVRIAAENGAVIRFDEAAASPYFNYSRNGEDHEVWFEDCRSYMAKLRLVPEYGFTGVGVWNAMRPFAQGWLVMQAGYRIVGFL